MARTSAARAARTLNWLTVPAYGRGRLNDDERLRGATASLSSSVESTRTTRIVTGSAWAVVAALAVFLMVQRYRDALATGVGMDLGFWLDAVDILRGGGDPYDAEWYTYTPLTAWVLLLFPDRATAMAVWTTVQLAAGAAAIGFVVAAHRRILPAWRAPLVAGLAVFTLFYSKVLSIELFLGQNQLMIMALLAAAVLVANRRPVIAGMLLAVAALVKTWPLLFGVWLVRSGARNRIRAILAWLATMVAFAVVMVITLGPASIPRLIERTLALREQPLAVYSVWFFARHRQASGESPTPFAEAAPAGQAVTLVLLVCMLGLIVLALLRPGTASLAMWNLSGAVVLLLPVSHPFYRLLILPLLWVWCAELLGRRAKVLPSIAVASLGLWWVLTARIVDPVEHTGWAPWAVVVSTVVVVALSTIFAALSTRAPAYDESRSKVEATA